MIIKTILPVLLVQKQSCQDEEHPNFSLFPLCATVSSWIFPKAEKSLVLIVVSLYNNETFDSIRDEIFSWCYHYCLSGLSSPKNLCNWVAFILKLKMAPWKFLTQYGFPIKLFGSPNTENDGNPVFWLVTLTGSTGMSSHVPSRDCPLLILHRKDL